MKQGDFEAILDAICSDLTAQAREKKFPSSKDFEEAVRRRLESRGKAHGLSVDFNPHPHAFPDIVVGKFGIEVKFSDKDTWRSVANSVFEGRRNNSVEQIYLLFGKMGGTPEARWGGYADHVIHVRTSHVPRFEVELSDKPSLFAQFGVSYPVFQALSPEAKMEHIRSYARGRLKEGERLWWLESGSDDDDHTLPIQARLYTSLTTPEKRRLRAEAALLCPDIVRPSRSKKKYDDAALYILTYHGVLCTQVRDLFSAGSVAMRSDDTRGGLYIERALIDIEAEMITAARDLEPALFEEYWGMNYPPSQRIQQWLKRVDKLAGDEWTPSQTLFPGLSNI